MARTPEVVELRCCRPAGAGGPTLAAAEAALAPEERTRAGRFARPEDRALFATARWLARTMLEEATGIAAQAWRFSAAVHGKPVATAEGVRPDRAPHVNWAHTGGLVVCGLARGVEVGVDVESTRRQARTAALARRFFHPDEVRDLAADPCDPRRFWATWTLKEACLKALGTGFTRSPQSFAVDPGPPPRMRTRQDTSEAPRAWSLFWTEVRHFVVAAAALGEVEWRLVEQHAGEGA